MYKNIETWRLFILATFCRKVSLAKDNEIWLAYSKNDKEYIWGF